MNPDQLAELEEERNFLLRSLVDLEREHAVGDVDDVDYHELREGYTVRAAATLRAIDDGRDHAAAASRAPNWKRRGLVAGGLVVAVLGDLVGAGDVVGGAHAGPGDHRSRSAVRTAATDGAGAGDPVPVAGRGRRAVRTGARLRSGQRRGVDVPRLDARARRGADATVDHREQQHADDGAERRRSSPSCARPSTRCARRPISTRPTPTRSASSASSTSASCRQPAAAQPWVAGLSRRQSTSRHPRSRRKA